MEKTSQKNWLKDPISTFYLGESTQLARDLYEGWDDIELKQCWFDLELVLNSIIKEYTGKTIPALNHYLVLVHANKYIAKCENFLKFLEKWEAKLNGKKSKKLYTLHVMLLALLILKKSSEEETESTINTILKTYHEISLLLQEVALTKHPTALIKSETQSIRAQKDRPTQRKILAEKIIMDHKNKYNEWLSTKEVGKKLEPLISQQSSKEKIMKGLSSLVSRIKRKHKNNLQ